MIYFSFCVIFQTLIIGSRYYFFDIFEKIENNVETAVHEYKMIEFYVFIITVYYVIMFLTAAVVFFTILSSKVETNSIISLTDVYYVFKHGFISIVILSLEVSISKLVTNPLLAKLKNYIN